VNYSTTINVNSLTLKSNPKVTRIPITLGLLYHFEVYFPPGPSGLLHVQLFDGAHQVYPSNEGSDYIGDNVTIAFDDLYVKESSPNELIAICWNDDDSFTQEVIIRFSILPRQVFQTRFAPTVSSEQLQEIIDLLTAEQNKPLSQAAQNLLQTYSQNTPEGIL